MDFSAIELTKNDRVAYVTLNRPRALNGITFEMISELNHAMNDVRGDQSVKALVITGAGNTFCVGADIQTLSEGFHNPKMLRDFLEAINGMFFNIEALPVPVIALVNGLTRAGGLEMLLSCDLAIANEQAKIGDNHTHFGVMPGGGATQRAPRKIGMQRAMELIYTGRWLTGQEAAEYGMVLKAVPHEKLQDALEEVLSYLREKSRDCLGFVKQAMLGGAHLPLRDGVSLEIRLFMEYMATSPDSLEGFTAYKEKRKPAYAGG